MRFAGHLLRYALVFCKTANISSRIFHLEKETYYLKTAISFKWLCWMFNKTYKRWCFDHGAGTPTSCHRVLAGMASVGNGVHWSICHCHSFRGTIAQRERVDVPSAAWLSPELSLQRHCLVGHLGRAWLSEAHFPLLPSYLTGVSYGPRGMPGMKGSTPNETPWK